MPVEPQRARPGPPIVVLMIGDGMGVGQIETASWFAHGAPGRLQMQTLPVQATNRTGSLSGVTDSAASATTLASGALSFNRRLGLDAHGTQTATLFDVARENGLATGVATTSHVAHATPAAFLVHHPARFEYPAIAEQLAEDDATDVLFGGGQRYLGTPPETPGLRDALADARADALRRRGAELFYDAEALGAWSPETTPNAYGLFADAHLTYVADGPPDAEPSLLAMTEALLSVFDGGARGGIVMIEGARIDHACHNNDLERSIAETLAFDEAVAAAAAWVAERPNATLIVTADHETGGLDLVEGHAAGQLPDVRWRTGNHSNDDVPVYAVGPCAERLDGALTSHAALHATMQACLTGAPLPDPATRPRTLDGHTDDLRTQVPTDGEAIDGLYVDADDVGFWLGVDLTLDPPPAGGVLAVVSLGGELTPPDAAWVRSADGVGEALGIVETPPISDGAWHAYHWVPASSLAAYDSYAEDVTGARGRGSAQALPWFANVSSAAAGRGTHRARGGVEWLLPWAALTPDGRRPNASFRVGVAVVGAGGAIVAWHEGPAESTRFVVDASAEGVATSHIDPR